YPAYTSQPDAAACWLSGPPSVPLAPLMNNRRPERMLFVGVEHDLARFDRVQRPLRRALRRGRLAVPNAAPAFRLPDQHGAREALGMIRPLAGGRPIDGRQAEFRLAPFLEQALSVFVGGAAEDVFQRRNQQRLGKC